MKDIVIVGAGGFGREVAWLIEQINQKDPIWNLIGFVDDNNNEGQFINGLPVLGKVEWLLDKSIHVVIAIGDPILKHALYEKIKESSNIYPSLIHPFVKISNTNRIGDGAIICEGSILTVNIKIGNHVIINLDCTIGHDVNIFDFCTVLPSVNISGHVNLNERVMVGTGAQILQGLNVGENSIVGAGSLVNRDLEKNVVAVGVPARVIKSRLGDKS
jgi:sugar O-acyltransferase (sialic acid O-acetyltransferase NeuD family)